MAGPIPTTVRIEELIAIHEELMRINNSLGIAIKQMRDAKLDTLYIPGKVSMEDLTVRGANFVNHAIGQAFSPNPRKPSKTIVDAKLAEANAILGKTKKTTTKRKN